MSKHIVQLSERDRVNTKTNEVFVGQMKFKRMHKTWFLDGFEQTSDQSSKIEFILNGAKMISNRR